MVERKIGSDRPPAPPTLNKGNAGKGRPKGASNKLTADVKAAILGAFEKAGGEAYLVRIAREDPRTFCGLLGKLLPTTLAGDPDAPLRTVQKIQFELVRPKIDKADGTAT